MLVQLRMKSVSIRTICPFHDPVNLFFCATGPKLTPVSEECVSLPVSVCIYQKRRDRPGEDWEYSGELRQLAHCVSILVQPVQVRRRGAGRGPATCSYAAAPRIPSHFSSVLRLRRACRSLRRAFTHALPKKGPSSSISLDPFHLDSISHLFPARLCPRSTQLDLR